ncbi:MAG: 30S ribosomal protein S17e [Candidatus Bathyarchaeota archaeon]|nr:MAG: 30S ribosomal protein S17e [Candidatus Bathyarchaeota archaeon]
MGKVRPEHVKRVARELIERYPDWFSPDFQTNKEAVASLAEVESPKLRNRIAGYISSLMATASKEDEEEAEESFEDTEEDTESE